MTEERKVVIYRETWLHGLGMGETNGPFSVLLNSDGHMCCLGFAAEQICEATTAEILEESTPDNVPEVFLRGLPELVKITQVDDSDGGRKESWRNSCVCYDLMKINDSDDYADEQKREEDLKAKFATIGVVCEFTGEYPKSVPLKVRIAHVKVTYETVSVPNHCPRCGSSLHKDNAMSLSELIFSNRPAKVGEEGDVDFDEDGGPSEITRDGDVSWIDVICNECGEVIVKGTWEEEELNKGGHDGTNSNVEG